VAGLSLRRQPLKDSDDDRASKQRAEVQRAIAGLDRLARAMDRSTPRHPLATMMWGVASVLDEYLSSPASLVVGLPKGVESHLILGVLLVTGARHQEDYATIASRVASAPEVEQQKALARRRRKGRAWPSRMASATTAVETYSRMINALWAVGIIVLVIFLIATRKLDPTTIQLQR
jgi:hypothetical protein